MKALPVLPCHPCPHGNRCCSKGTNLRDDEAADIAEKYGAKSVILLVGQEIHERFAINGGTVSANTLWNRGAPEWATAVNQRGCVFLEPDGSCRLYAESFYPQVCRMFPWKDLASADRAEDAELCPAHGQPMATQTM